MFMIFLYFSCRFFSEWPMFYINNNDYSVAYACAEGSTPRPPLEHLKRTLLKRVKGGFVMDCKQNKPRGFNIHLREPNILTRQYLGLCKEAHLLISLLPSLLRFKKVKFILKLNHLVEKL